MGISSRPRDGCAGRKSRCPKCGTPVTVPSPSVFADLRKAVGAKSGKLLWIGIPGACVAVVLLIAVLLSRGGKEEKRPIAEKEWTREVAAKAPEKAQAEAERKAEEARKEEQTKTEALRKAEEERQRKVQAEEERRRQEAAQAEAARRAAAAQALNLKSLKEGQYGLLPKSDYTIINVPRNGPMLVRAGTDTYFIISGISPGNLASGAAWGLDPKAVFTVLKPEPSKMLKEGIPHVTQDPTTRTGFKKE